MRIGIGGIWHETNTFAPGLTGLEDFRAWQFAAGQDVLERYAGTRTEIAGALDACRGLGAEPVPLLAAAALPSGTIAAEARQALWDELLGRLAAALPLDGLVLALHGAMVAEDRDDPESDLMAAVRGLVGEIPVAVTLDLHANPGRGLLEQADAVVAYDTYPHVDPYERGAEATKLLARLFATGELLRVAWRRLPLLTCPVEQATNEEPMASLLDLVHGWEERPELACASLIPGYPYADVQRLGFTVVACGEAAAAEDCTASLAEAVLARRESFRRDLASPEEAVARALASPRGPVVLADVADNVGGGAPGNSTAILDALVAAEAEGAVVVLWDPAAALAATDGSGPGELLVSRPVAYRRTGSYMTGQWVDLGLCAAVRLGGVEVVYTTRRLMPFDADHLRVLGIEPAERRIIAVKSAIAWQAGFGDLAAEAIYVDSPGVCTCRLETLPYRRFTGWGDTAQPLP